MSESLNSALTLAEDPVLSTVERAPRPFPGPVVSGRVLSLEDSLAEKSALEQLLKAEEKLAEQRKGVIAELLEQRKEIDAQLRQLGYTGSNAAPKKGTRSKSDAPCSVCGFKTNPPHDARGHRAQKKKEPFTKAELDEKGLTKA